MTFTMSVSALCYRNEDIASFYSLSHSAAKRDCDGTVTFDEQIVGSLERVGVKVHPSWSAADIHYYEPAVLYANKILEDGCLLHSIVKEIGKSLPDDTIPELNAPLRTVAPDVCQVVCMHPAIAWCGNLGGIDFGVLAKRDVAHFSVNLGLLDALLRSLDSTMRGIVLHALERFHVRQADVLGDIVSVLRDRVDYVSREQAVKALKKHAKALDVIPRKAVPNNEVLFNWWPLLCMYTGSVREAQTELLTEFLAWLLHFPVLETLARRAGGERW